MTLCFAIGTCCGTSSSPARKTGPATDVVEDADTYHFYFEMAGINSESVDVRVEDGNLIVEAERKRPEWSKDAEVHLSERAYGTMRRAFTMPEDASHEKSRRPTRTECWT